MIQGKIGFIGAGQMAGALASGVVESGLVDAERIWAADPEDVALLRFADQVPGAHMVHDNRQVVAEADVLILAVKPQQLGTALSEISGEVGEGHLVISICAGVPLSSLAAALPGGSRLVRVMPNAPCMVGQSASGYCLGRGVSEADRELVSQMLSAVGIALELEEKLLDAVTGLAGSGPAFVYLIIEALSDGGVLMGLPRDAATTLAAQTVRGAAEMVLKTGQHPAVLKDRVASPAGTTIAGLKALESAATRAAIVRAVEAATQRSIELGQQAAKPS